MNGSGEDLKKVFIRTYGCQMNVYDSERMTDALAPLGYVEAASPEAADLILLNTCHIREKAAEKVYSELGRLRRLKAAAARAGRSLVVGVAGCVAQAEGEEIVRRAPAVDLVVGPQSYHRLPELLAEARPGRPVVATDFAVEEKFAVLDRHADKGSRGRGSQSARRRPDGRAAGRRLPHRAGRLRQVLHLLRRALHARRRGVAAGGGDRRRGDAACARRACAS